MNNTSIHYARGKTLGGCTARNYMAFHRSTKDAYQKWADDVDDQSYTFENLLPYFQRSIHYTPPGPQRAENATAEVDLSTLAPQNKTDENPLSVTFSNYAQPISSWVEKALQQIGINPIKGFTSGDLLGSSYPLLTIEADTQIRDSSETSFLRSAMKSDNLMVYISTLATKVLFDGNKTATGVKVDTQGLEYTLSARKEVILSAGAFQSPQLLLVSGIGDKETLERYDIPVVAHRPGVGQNMWVSIPPRLFYLKSTIRLIMLQIRIM